MQTLLRVASDVPARRRQACYTSDAGSTRSKKRAVARLEENPKVGVARSAHRFEDETCRHLEPYTVRRDKRHPHRISALPKDDNKDIALRAGGRLNRKEFRIPLTGELNPVPRTQPRLVNSF